MKGSSIKVTLVFDSQSDGSDGMKRARFLFSNFCSRVTETDRNHKIKGARIWKRLDRRKINQVVIITSTLCVLIKPFLSSK